MSNPLFSETPLLEDPDPFTQTLLHTPQQAESNDQRKRLHPNDVNITSSSTHHHNDDEKDVSYDAMDEEYDQDNASLRVLHNSSSHHSKSSEHYERQSRSSSMQQNDGGMEENEGEDVNHSHSNGIDAGEEDGHGDGDDQDGSYDEEGIDTYRDDRESSATAGRTKASSPQSLVNEWETMFGDESYLMQLKQRGLEGTLRHSNFRNICWKIFLGVLPQERQDWIRAMKVERDRYAKVRAENELDPNKMTEGDLLVNNPLSQVEDSPWQQFFKDKELRQQIRQDVERTFPESEFFQSALIQECMINILFCYAKLNADLSYRQGMHELLAPVLFILHREYNLLQDTADNVITEEMSILLDKNYIEHDAYALFNKIMTSVRNLYSQGDSKLMSQAAQLSQLPKSATPLSFTPFAKDKKKEVEEEITSEVVKKLKHIQHKLLHEVDPSLYAHLQNLQIEPQLYGLRWVRLLLGREFHLSDVLTIWDALFADSAFLSLLDYICVAMLSYIRQPLLISDYIACLKRLLKFPPLEDVHTLIEKALKIRDPTYRSSNTTRRSNSNASTTNPPTSYSLSGSTGNSSYSSVSRTPSSTLAAASASGPSLGSRNAGQLSQSLTLSSTPAMSSSANSPSRPSSNTAARPVAGSSMHYSAGQATKHHAQPKSTPKTSTLSGLLGSVSSSVKAAVLGTQSSGPSSTNRQSNSTLSNSTNLNSSRKTYVNNPAASDLGENLPSSGEKLGVGLEEQLANMRTMNAYCGEQLHILIQNLESQLLSQPLPNRELVMLSLAGMKQVKDMLRGNVKFDPDAMSISAKSNQSENSISERLNRFPSVSSQNSGEDGVISSESIDSAAVAVNDLEKKNGSEQNSSAAPFVVPKHNVVSKKPPVFLDSDDSDPLFGTYIASKSTSAAATIEVTSEDSGLSTSSFENIGPL